MAEKELFRDDIFSISYTLSFAQAGLCLAIKLLSELAANQALLGSLPERRGICSLCK